MSIRKSGQFGRRGEWFFNPVGGGAGDAQTTKVLLVNSKADRLAATLGKRKPTETPNFCSPALAVLASLTCL